MDHPSTIRTNAFLFAALSALSAGVGADDLAGTLLHAASNVDYYQVQCSNDGGGPTSFLELRIRDTAGINANAVFSAQIIRGAVAVNTTDNGPDGDTRPSPWIRVHGGDGNYQVLVTKNRAGTDDYNLEYCCRTATHIHSGTAIVQLQNR